MQHLSQNNFCSGVSASSNETVTISSTHPIYKLVLLCSDSHSVTELTEFIKPDQWHKQYFSCGLLKDAEWSIINLHFYVAQDCHLEGCAVIHNDVPSKCNQYFTHPKSTANLSLPNFPTMWCAHFVLWNGKLSFKNTFATCAVIRWHAQTAPPHLYLKTTEGVDGRTQGILLSLYYCIPFQPLVVNDTTNWQCCQQWTKWRWWLTIYCSD
jgi:hypothetical protein